MAKDKESILLAIASLASRLREIDSEREKLLNDLSRLRLDLEELDNLSLGPSPLPSICSQSPLNEKIALFRSLFSVGKTCIRDYG